MGFRRVWWAGPAVVVSLYLCKTFLAGASDPALEAKLSGKWSCERPAGDHKARYHAVMQLRDGGRNHTNLDMRVHYLGKLVAARVEWDAKWKAFGDHIAYTFSEPPKIVAQVNGYPFQTPPEAMEELRSWTKSPRGQRIVSLLDDALVFTPSGAAHPVWTCKRV